jgi:prepilin-type processing-associated H-X9-DG protein
MDIRRAHARSNTALLLRKRDDAPTRPGTGLTAVQLLAKSQMMPQTKTAQLASVPRPANRTSAGTSPAGFTFVELLCIIGFFGVVTAVLMPGLARARQKSIQTSCTANLGQISRALQMYAQANRESLPGPVHALARASYDQTSTHQLSWFLAEHLGHPKPSKERIVAEELICPAQAGQLSDAPSGRTAPSYALQERLKASDGTRLQPFGRIAEPAATPLKLSTLAAYGSPSRMKAMSDADKANGNPTLRDWGLLPYRPVHGSVRIQLFFDGHVAETTW